MLSHLSPGVSVNKVGTPLLFWVACCANIFMAAALHRRLKGNKRPRKNSQGHLF